MEALTSLLGIPTNFACTLDTWESTDGSKIAYAIKAEDGTFRVGRDYRHSPRVVVDLTKRVVQVETAEDLK